MVDAVVCVFLEQLHKALAEESHILSECGEQFQKLKSELQLMQSFLKDAERLKRKNEVLRTIMGGLRELIYEAEDILADCQVKLEDDNPQFSGRWLMCMPPTKLPFQYRIGKRLQEINEKIMSIKQNISSYLGPPILVQPEMGDAINDQVPRWSSPVYDHTLVVGLEEDTKKMKDWLFAADVGVLAIGVVGMGGVGKTTVAQKVLNDREVEGHFERRIWVSVSQTFSEEQIMRSMLRNLGDVSAEDDKGELLKKINQYLTGKRYLIVMDDVWSRDVSWWLRIHEGLPKGNGSCIIITTRIEEVSQKMGVKEAKLHWPKLLSEEESLLLFNKIAFAASGGACVYQELESVGREIVEKCKGLPLAIKAAAGMMLCKPKQYHEWRRISNHFRDELAENDSSVMATLQLSYDELPSYLKSCFLSFSLYPEDCVITKEQLVHWWIGEGFVPLRNGASSVQAGENCFSGLANRCLIEVVERGYNGMIYTCKVHDMVRDLVIKMAEDDAFFQVDGINCRHFGITCSIDEKHLVSNHKLRALLSTTKPSEVNKVGARIAKKFCECRYMRVLDLSKTIFEKPLMGLLNQIGCLQHLTHLSLSNTHPLVQLPPSLQKLENLQILDLSYCQNLKELPYYIVKFKKLRVLDISHCGSLQFVPKGLGRLSNLEVLLGFRPGRARQFHEGCRIGELKSLTRLRMLGLLVTREDEIEDHEVNALVNLQELQFLSLSCFDSQGGDLIAKLDKLSPPPQLHELCLKFYPGKMSPSWLNPSSLPMLRFLSISSGDLVKMAQGFWGEDGSVWKIEGLSLECLSELEEEWGKVQQALPLLTTVRASWCPELDSFPIQDIGFRGGVWSKEDKFTQN